MNTSTTTIHTNTFTAPPKQPKVASRFRCRRSFCLATRRASRSALRSASRSAFRSAASTRFASRSALRSASRSAFRSAAFRSAPFGRLDPPGGEACSKIGQSVEVHRVRTLPSPTLGAYSPVSSNVDHAPVGGGAASGAGP